MKTKEQLLTEILATRADAAEGYSEYGSRVLPAMRIYKALATYEERKAFQDALESLLTSSKKDDRAFAVDLCLGFFVFRDAL